MLLGGCRVDIEFRNIGIGFGLAMELVSTAKRDNRSVE